VPALSPPPRPNPHSRVTPTAASRSHTLEATGLLIVAVLVLIITLARYWHHLAWSTR
jgi:hypothetical protein